MFSLEWAVATTSSVVKKFCTAHVGTRCSKNRFLILFYNQTCTQNTVLKITLGTLPSAFRFIRKRNPLQVAACPPILLRSSCCGEGGDCSHDLLSSSTDNNGDPYDILTLGFETTCLALHSRKLLFASQIGKQCQAAPPGFDSSSFEPGTFCLPGRCANCCAMV